MGVFYDKIGFLQTVDKGDGIWSAEYTEREYPGQLSRLSRRWQRTDKINSNVEINLVLSLIMDDFIENHVGDIRYVVYNNYKWAVINIEIERPRITLTIGGLYNAKTEEIAENS